MYEEGRGVDKDEAQAVAWYRKAAEEDHTRAQAALGRMFANGRGIAKDRAPGGDPPFDVFKDCDVCPEMVALPGGTFTMGSPRNEGHRRDNEGPQRQVTIKPFAIGKHEVTDR
jgi:formylglycine-generating enzyme required for sulfatase activity